MGEPALKFQAQSVSRHLPFLRRHARMMLGGQADADRFVVLALESFRPQGSDDARDDLRTEMFRSLYKVLRPRLGDEPEAALADDRKRQADQRLGALSWMHRAVLLMTAVEGLSDRAVAAVLARPVSEIGSLAERAQAEIERGLETSVLIIEDEWTIARDLRRIVSDLGHSIAGMAAKRDDAVEMARRTRPGLILADINLADGSSGIDAVRDIFENGVAPTIFITAYPEKLLTGERPEPTYLISKPYSPEMIQATVSQALFFSDGARH